MSGWQDSNLRPPAPKAGAITGLRYTPKGKISNSNGKDDFAESKGFEPLVQLPIRLFSKQVLSATQATLQYSMNVHRLSGCKCKLTFYILQVKNTFFKKFFSVFCKLTRYQ